MKYSVRRLLSLSLALAMLLSLVAFAEDGMTELGMDQPIEIEGGFEGEDQTGNDSDTQAPEGELEIDMDEAGGLPDGDVDPVGGEELDLSLDLDGESLETFEEALAPETEEAMNAGETWTLFNDQLPPTTAGNYEIPDGGLSLPHSWTVPTNGVTKLKLSGLLNLGSSYDIQVNDGATLEIFSESNQSILGSNYYLIRLNGRTFKLHGGTIEGDSTSNPVTGVHVVSGTFTMDGGEISVKAAGGVGVINQGTFTMEKGKISAEGDGAKGVLNTTGNTSGTFEMDGDAGTCTISAKGLGAAGVDNDVIVNDKRDFT